MANIAPTTQTNESAADVAVDFLNALRPGEPWLLIAIAPDGPGPMAITARTDADARRFVNKWNGRRNLYYGVNPTKYAMSRKPKKADIAMVEYLHCDLDPDKGETPQQAQARYDAAIDTYGICPTLVVNSGNGLNCLWRLTEPVPLDSDETIADIEARNLALVLALGGPPGTQNVDRILRLPGTINLPTVTKRKAGRKRSNAQWRSFDDAAYGIDEFPPAEAPSSAAATTSTKKPNKDIPPDLMELIRNGVEAPDRSQRFMTAVGWLKRLGRSEPDVIDLFRQYPDGIAAKYSGRATRLRDEVRRAYGKIKDDKPGSGERTKARSIEVVRLSDVKMKPVEWVWPLRLARGKVTIAAGDPGQGKSQLAIDAGARITRGGEWPDGEKAPTGSVIILSGEDSLDDTVLPRFAAAGGDMAYVHAVKMVTDEEGNKRTFNMRTDLDQLAALIRKIRRDDNDDVVLVIVDPVSAYMGELDSRQMTTVNPVMAQVADFAERNGVGVLVIHHPPKDTPRKAIHHFSGSLAFVAGPRLVFIVVEDQDDKERRLLLPVKNNLGPLAPGLSYRVVAAGIDRRILTSKIEYDGKPVKLGASEALRAANSGDKEPSKLEHAKEYLRARLAGGPILATDLISEAADWGIRERTLREAKRQCGIADFTDGYQGPSYWSLPKDASRTARRADDATLGKRRT